MKCPNCGKEAINVNGRYVCLDCGIELTTNGTPVEPSDPSAPMVNNHTSQPSVAPASPVTETSLPANDVAEPVEVTGDAQAQNPFASGFSMSAEPGIPEATDSETPTTPTIPDVPDDMSGVAEEPANVPAEPSAAPGSDLEVETNSQDNIPKPAEPVKDMYIKQLNQQESSGNVDFGAGQGSAAPGTVVPDFPDPAKSNPGLPGEAAAENLQNQPPALAEPSANLNSDLSGAVPTPIPDNNIVLPATETGALSPSVEPSLPVNSEQNSAVQGTPPNPDVGYFQPSTLNITGQSLSASADNFPSETTAVQSDTNVSGQPINPGVPSELSPLITQSFTPQTSAVVGRNNPVGMGQNQPLNQDGAPLFDPLSPGDSAENILNPTSSVLPAQTPGTIPGSTNIPSTESVFGEQAVEVTPTLVQKLSKNMLWLWIALGVLGFLLLIGGGIFAYFMYQSSQSGNAITQNNNGQILTISQDVAGQMDSSTDVAANFDQTLDFSGVKPKDSSEALFFSKPIELKGTWGVNSAGDVSIDATNASVPAKRIFIKAENATYVYSADTKTWVKTDGSQLSPATIFFPVDSRGSLFYLSRVDSFSSLGTDTVGTESVKKIKVILKKESVQEMLSAVAPSLAANKYSATDISNLSVTAWVNDQNQILKIAADGVIKVTSDLYTGPVIVNASGNYLYQTQTVKKPV